MSFGLLAAEETAAPGPADAPGADFAPSPHEREIATLICFTPGARILTPRGERAIETLRPGDPVITRDHGPQPIRWLGSRTVTGTGPCAPVRLAPSVRGTGSEGLLVSPHHRVLYTGYSAELLFGDGEVLVRAGDLVDGQTVRACPCPTISYLHLMFDRHEVIYAEGIATESFHAADPAIAALDPAARAALFAAFPELRSAPGRHRETARYCLAPHEAALLRSGIEGCAA
jgi:hypothetical protein